MKKKKRAGFFGRLWMFLRNVWSSTRLAWIANGGEAEEPSISLEKKLLKSQKEPTLKKSTGSRTTQSTRKSTASKRRKAS